MSAVELRVVGPDLDKVSRALKEFGPEAQRQIGKRLQVQGGRVAAKQRSRFRSVMGAPREWKDEAARNVRVVLVPGGVSVQVRRTGGTWGAWLINRGHWDHPTYGRRPMVRQVVARGAFDDPARESHPAARRDAAAALGRAADEIAARIGRAGT